MPTDDCDFVTDQNPALLVYLSEKGLVPDYVSKSARVTPEETDPLSVVAFADPFNRKFPCHTKTACWMSAAYYAGHNMDDSNVLNNIVKMASAHEILEDVTTVIEELKGSMQKAASNTTQDGEPGIRKYAMTVDFDGFQGRAVEDFYPINTYTEVLTSSDDATRDFRAGAMPMAAMRKTACAIVDAAVECKVPLEDLTAEVRSLGVKRLPDPYAAGELIGVRKNANVDVTPYKEKLEALAVELGKCASADDAIELADATAAELCRLDAVNNITYNSRMPNPYDILFTGPTLEELHKAAAQLVNIEGVNVPVADFLNLQDATIEKTFSTGISEVIKAAKADVSGDCTMEKCAAASEKILTLTPEARKVLLAVLADTAW